MSQPTPICLKGHTMKRNPRVKKLDIWTCPEGCEYTINTEPGFYRDPEAPPVELTCGCDCGTIFTPAFRHPDQDYLNVAHRMRAYRRRRREAAE